MSSEAVFCFQAKGINYGEKESMVTNDLYSPWALWLSLSEEDFPIIKTVWNEHSDPLSSLYSATIKGTITKNISPIITTIFWRQKLPFL